MKQFKKQFSDPAVMEMHEKNMQEMKMGSDHAMVFFQKLEQEAKLAGRCEDTDARGMMVATVRQGVPQSFTRIITDIGFGISTTYDEWKERILTMYKEQERNKAYNQMHSLEWHDKKPSGNQKQITATSKNTAGGATSSSTGKTGGNNKGRDAGGRWTTLTGTDAKMQIDAKKQKHHKEGRCFRCNEKGHLSKDCPTKQVTVRSVEMEPKEPLAESTRVEEVKE